MPFSDIYGQERQAGVLQNTIKRDRIPHAYLFHGIEGIGKRTTAKILAKALNCKEQNADSCEICNSCLKIEHGNHPDVIFIKPDGVFIKIAAIRNLQDQIKFRPFEGRKRVFIIAEADRMNEPSANALLKTLEEPVPSNVFILTTSRVHRLPQTIISRCQKIRFNPVRPDVIISFLTDRLSMNQDWARDIASSAGGSIGRALAIQKESFADFKHDVITVLSKTCTAPISLFFLADSFGNDRESALQKLDILRGWYRDMLVYRETHDVNKLINRDIADATKEFSKKLAGIDILESIKIISNAHAAIDRNANRQLVLESMAFRLKACNTG